MFVSPTVSNSADRGTKKLNPHLKVEDTGKEEMLKKIMISAFAASVIAIGLQAPASAAMMVGKPAAAQSEAASDIIVVRNRRGGVRHRGRGFRHRGGSRHRNFRHRRWHKGHWRWRRHHGWRGHGYRGRRWAAYRHCRWKQDQGYRIRCYRPGYY